MKNLKLIFQELIIIIAFVIGAEKLSAQDPIIFDFETTQQGWIVENHPKVKGAVSARRSTLKSFNGKNSLKVTLSLSNNADSTSQGEVRVDLSEDFGIIDLTNYSMVAYIHFPFEFEGAGFSPNGIQIFAKSFKVDSLGKEHWGSLYSRWKDAAGKSGDWVELKLKITDIEQSGVDNDQFDPSKVRMIGVKFGLGGKAPRNQLFEGDIFVDFIQLKKKNRN